MSSEIYEEVVKDAVKLSGVVWSRVELAFSRWPLKLLRRTDEVFREFLEELPCCIDCGFSEPLRAVYSSMEALRSPACACLLQAMSRHAATTNMGLERRIAQTRQSVPYSKHHPSAESIYYHDILSQVDHW